MFKNFTSKGHDLWRIITTNRISFLVIVFGMLIAIVTQRQVTLDQKVNFILGLMVLIATAEIYERTHQLHNINDKLEAIPYNFRLEIASRFSAKYLTGETEIVNEVSRVQRSGLFSHLRVVVYEIPKSPDRIIMDLINILRERRDLNIAITMVLLLDFDKVTPEFLAQLNNRLLLYESNGINMKQLNLRSKNVSPPIGIDTYIIDTNHIVFNFTDMGKEGVLYKAILIENKPEVASSYIDWFERTVLPNSITLEELNSIISQKNAP